MLKLHGAWLSNAMEEDEQELKFAGSGVEIGLRPYQIVTVRIEGEIRQTR